MVRAEPVQHRGQHLRVALGRAEHIRRKAAHLGVNVLHPGLLRVLGELRLERERAMKGDEIQIRKIGRRLRQVIRVTVLLEEQAG